MIHLVFFIFFSVRLAYSFLHRRASEVDERLVEIMHLLSKI